MGEVLIKGNFVKDKKVFDLDEISDKENTELALILKKIEKKLKEES